MQEPYQVTWYNTAAGPQHEGMKGCSAALPRCILIPCVIDGRACC